MRQFVLHFLALSSCGLMLACGVYPGPQRAAWRNEAESACVRSDYVQPSEKIVPADPIGFSGCGMRHPFKVAELPQSRVALSKPVTMACPMIPALDNWMKDVVQPAAAKNFGSPVVEIEAVGSYSCRRINGSGNMSEHAYGNAFDVSGFKLADGRRVKVGQGFVNSSASFQMSAKKPAHSPPTYAPPIPDDGGALREEWEEKVLAALAQSDDGAPSYQTASRNFTPPPLDADLAFLDEVRFGACGAFATVLGPGQADHEDHLHMDLALRKSGKRVCK